MTVDADKITLIRSLSGIAFDNNLNSAGMIDLRASVDQQLTAARDAGLNDYQAGAFVMYAITTSISEMNLCPDEKVVRMLAFHLVCETAT